MPLRQFKALNGTLVVDAIRVGFEAGPEVSPRADRMRRRVSVFHWHVSCVRIEQIIRLGAPF